MTWFTNPAGLFAFLGLPAVLLLHLYRQRHQLVPVSSLFLWISPHSTESSGRTRQPLRRTPSFWLEMLAALLLALFLSGFNPLAASDATHLIVVLDDSASMSARTGADQVGPKQKLSAHLEAEFERLGRRTRVTLIRSGVRPTLLCGPAALLPEARTALAQWQPKSPSHDRQPAIRLASELAGGGEVWFMSDGLPSQKESWGNNVRFLCFGEPAVNAAIVEARRVHLEGQSGDQVECTIRAFGTSMRQHQLWVRVAGEPMAERTLDLQGGKDTKLVFPLPAGTPAVQISLADDSLLLDNQVTLFPLPDRTVHIGFQLEENAISALRLAEFPNALPGVKRTAEISNADLVIAHQAAAAPAWSLVLPANPSNSADAEAYVAGFLPEKRHPLLRGLTFQGVLWARAKEFPVRGIPLLSIGDLPLLGESFQGGAAIYTLNLLAQRSTLAQSPDWPILMSNLVELRRAALEGPREVNLIAGQAFEYVFHGRKDFTLSHGESSRMINAEDLLQVEDLPASEGYVLQSEGKEVARFAVNFMDASESDLSLRNSAGAAPAVGDIELAQQAYAESPMGRILLLLLCGALVADWLYLGRGRGQ